MLRRTFKLKVGLQETKRRGTGRVGLECLVGRAWGRESVLGARAGEGSPS